MYELLDLVTQRGSDGEGSAGDAEECDRESQTGLFDDVLFLLLAMLFWSFMLKALFAVRA